MSRATDSPRNGGLGRFLELVERLRPLAPPAPAERANHRRLPPLVRGLLAVPARPGRRRPGEGGAGRREPLDGQPDVPLPATRPPWRPDPAATAELLDRLTALDDAPWADQIGGKSDKARGSWLARNLRPYGISSRTLRIGDSTPKGYEAGDFADTWRRYLRVDR